jgi:zinc protease
MLRRILVDGDSSRLHRLLVEDKQLAISVGGFEYAGFDPGLVYFYLTLPPDGDLAVVEQRMFEELQRVAEEGVTEQELSKARNIALAEFWRELATINGKAQALGVAAVFHGSYERLFDLPQEIEAVSTDDVRRVAAKILRRNNATVGVLRAPQVGDEE